MNTTRANLVRRLVSKLSPKICTFPASCGSAYAKIVDKHRWLVDLSYVWNIADIIRYQGDVLYPVLTGFYVSDALDEDAHAIVRIVHNDGNSLEASLPITATQADDINAVHAALNTTDEYIRMNAFDCGLMVTGCFSVSVSVGIGKARRRTGFIEVVYISDKWETQAFTMGDWSIKLDGSRFEAVMTNPVLSESEHLLSVIDRRNRSHRPHILGFSDPLEDHPIWEIEDDLSVRDPDMASEDTCLLYA